MKRNIILLLLGVLFITSCAKKPDLTNVDTNEGNVFYEFDFLLSSLNSEKYITNKLAATRTQNFTNDRGVEYELGNGYSINSNVEISKYNFISSSGDVKRGVNTKLAASGNTHGNDYENISKQRLLADGVRYVVLVFNDKDEHISTGLGTVGANSKIRFKVSMDHIGTSNNYFRFVAFTYNSDEAIDISAYDPAVTNNNPKIQIPIDKEFLYYNGSYFVGGPSSDTKAGDVIRGSQIQIVFVPKTVKVGITVDGRTAGVKLKSIEGSFSGISFAKKMELDLKNNTLTDLGAYGASDIPNTFRISKSSSVDTLSVYRYLYFDNDLTDIQKNIVNFTANLTSIVIDNMDGTQKNILPSSYSSYYGNVILSEGLFFNGKINLLSGFQVSYFDVNNVITKKLAWAYGNLYYDLDDSGNQYKIRNQPNEGKGSINTDYWVSNDNKYYMLPNTEQGEVGDPCTNVYPSGTWRMPSKEEAEAFLSANVTKHSFTRIFDESNKKSRFVEYTNVLGQKIRFYAHGYYNRNAAIGSDLVASFFIWSFTDPGTLISSDPRALVFTISSNTAEKVEDGEDMSYTGTNSDAVTNYDDEIATPKMNIRCVRDVQL